MVQVPPIVERELREALNKRKAVKTRLSIAAVTVIITFFWLAIGSVAGAKNLGRSLSSILDGIALYVVVVQPLLWTADILSIERRNRTLGLLFLAGLTAFEVFLSKLLSVVMVVFSNLLAILPLFAIPFLLGGVSMAEFAATICLLPNLLLLVVALSLLGSALNEDEGTALVLAVLLSCFLCFAGPAVYFGARFFSAAAPSTVWLIPSPAYGAWMVATHFRVGSLSEFWANAGCIFLYSTVALAAAAGVVHRNWRESDAGTKVNGLWRRLLAFVRRRSAAPRSLRRLWMERSPATCLITHDPRMLTVAYLMVMGIVALWIVCFIAWGKQWLAPWVGIGTAVLLNACAIVLAVYSGGGRIADDRRSGVLEVLLTTPLTEREIVVGLGNGIAWQFKQVFIAVFGINLLLLVAGLWGRHWNLKMVLDYIFLWGVVFSLALLTFRSARWTVIWVSLNTGRATYSMLRPLAPLLGVAFQFFFHSSELTGALAGFPTGSETETWLTGGICGTLVLLLWVWEDRTMMALLKKYLRYVGRQPLPEPADPRFKAWDIKKPFPCTRDDLEPQIRDFC